jgi:glutathione synthase/RimK-type ligase-like ATP-grasp enzyme
LEGAAFNGFLCNFITSTLNNFKLYILDKAKEVGFDIPDTIVTNKKECIQEFFNEKKLLITKTIHEQLLLFFENAIVGQKTEGIDIDNIEDNFSYSLFQEQIEKKYELRIFYFIEKFYSCAIFSQNSEKTKIDFRVADFSNSENNKITRIVPYSLPGNIKNKIKKLMKNIKMESGSIDMIVTTDDNYIFLEVNPVGQLDFVSKLCNYNIEKNIAKYIAYGNENKR